MASDFLPPIPDEVASPLTEQRIEAAIEAMAAHGFSFIQAVATLRGRAQVPLAEAKRLVHCSPAYAGTKLNRESFWQDLESLADEP